MPNYKLSYFNLKGLAEPIRFLLAYGGEPFEDHRLEMEQWPSIKPSTPFGKLPTLEIDGKIAHQSTAICRYLGKELGLAGKDNWEDLQIDIAMDTVHDFRLGVAGFRYETDEAVKAKKKEIALKETAPYYLEKINELVKKNNGHLANGKLSWADFCFVGLSYFLNVVLEFDLFEKYDGLRQLRDNVVSIPNIKKWIEKSPETPF